MMFLEYLIPLVGSFFVGQVFNFILLPVLLLALIATVPCIIRELVRFR